MAAEREFSAFLFADLAGFTALTEAHGDEEATTLAENFAARVQALLPDYGGDLIKTMGDEVMVRLAEPDRAVELGLRIVGELAKPGLPPVRVGIHCGPALRRDGDWFGGAVNLASRVSGAARAGEVLLTGHAVGSLSEGRFAVESRGERQFRHVVEPVTVYRVVDSPARHHLEIDPVCRMAVDPAAAAATRHRRGEVYYFCSGECERAFAADPRRYVATSPAARAARRGFFINLGAFVVLGVMHSIGWAMGHASGRGVPTFLIVGAVWAVVLVFHYRSVRRVL